MDNHGYAKVSIELPKDGEATIELDTNDKAALMAALTSAIFFAGYKYGYKRDEIVSKFLTCARVEQKTGEIQKAVQEQVKNDAELYVYERKEEVNEKDSN